MLVRRSCERPGCGQPVAVIYGQEPASSLPDSPQQFWIDSWSADLCDADPPVGSRGVLCAVHGEQLVPPRGWNLVDRRDVVPRLFKPRLVVDTSQRVSSNSPETKTRPMARSETVQRRMSDVPRPQLFSDLDRHEDDQPATTTDQNTDREISEIEIDGLLKPSGSLLRDAFRRSSGGKRDATKELLRPTSVPAVSSTSAESDSQ